MEKKLGRKFVKLTREEINLLEKLRKNAKSMIKGEISKKRWNSILRQYERYVRERKETGGSSCPQNSTQGADQSSRKSLGEICGRGSPLVHVRKTALQP